MLKLVILPPLIPCTACLAKFHSCPDQRFSLSKQVDRELKRLPSVTVSLGAKSLCLRSRGSHLPQKKAKVYEKRLARMEICTVKPPLGLSIAFHLREVSPYRRFKKHNSRHHRGRDVKVMPSNL